MPRTFFISDTHFSHENMLRFTRNNGERLRNFSSIEEMNETIVENWNLIVSTKDLVYHLGDVAMKFSNVSIVEQLKGRKILIQGNHDRSSVRDYIRYFQDVSGSIKYKEFVLSHYPIHFACLPHWCVANIHGHIHNEKMLLQDGSVDKRYFNVSVESINYTPIEIDQIREQLKGSD